MKVLDRDILNTKIVSHINNLLVKSLQFDPTKHLCPICSCRLEKCTDILNEHIAICRQIKTDEAIKTINVWRKKMEYKELDFLEHFTFKGLKINPVDIHSLKAIRKLFLFFALLPSAGILYNIFIILNAYNSCIYTGVTFKDHFNEETSKVIEASSKFHKIICSNFALRRQLNQYRDENEISFALFYSEILDLYHVNSICWK
ncbi:MAG: hypothetical protein Solivirus2_20 [Solivirus sp.]|uniref:Uncharacterized protein n=1 Tax=Solivirus sp. TaxID=2487772 RepID=A0A3G5AJT5_9VIRU|nr:MAG: hypothetical protein Solivirus2_20 [Solivirus sp.]